MQPQALTDRPPPGYYAQERRDLIARLPLPLGRVLDVGCGEGGAGRPLRERGAEAVDGIELVPEVAERAADSYDRVEVGDALEGADRLEGPYQTFLCYDVLEHLADPEPLVRRLRQLAADGAALHISIPNARFLRLPYDLLVRGTFDYRDYGHRDRTHLRWFTPRDLRTLVERCGWHVVESRPTTVPRRTGWLVRPTRGLWGELVSPQWQLLARATPAGTAIDRR